MPWYNGCFVSKKSIDRDIEVLKAQSLTPEQISSVSNYYIQRMVGYAYAQMGWFFAAMFFAAVFLWRVK